MIRSGINLLIFLLIGSQNEPKYDLHKRKEPNFLEGINWTFILLVLAMVLFFMFIWIFQIGNEYPNQLIENL